MHLNKKFILKQQVEFNDKDVIENQKILDEFNKNQLIKKQIHFCIDDKELHVMSDDKDEEEEDTNKNIFSQNNQENKENYSNKGYFKSIMEETMKNDSLYCSYLDSFDKMWIKNSKINEILF
jgi:hypothetical protein